MLLGNGTVTNKCPINFWAGSSASTETGQRASSQRSGAERNRFYVDQETTANKLWAEPSASYPPNSFTLLPQKGGWLSSRNETWATFTASGTALRGLPAEASTTFSITTNNPTGELVTTVPEGGAPASFSITTNTPLLTASINGTASSTFSITTNTPTLGAIASLVASSEFAITTNNPTMYPLDDTSPLREASATFSITGTLNRYAVGHMTGAALPYTELSPASLASAVWDSILVDYQQDGSAGKALGTASSGGVDLNLMAQAVWEYVSRTLTTASGNAPTAAEVAAAVLAAAQTTPIEADIKQVNSVPITGSGVPNTDEWRPA